MQSLEINDRPTATAATGDRIYFAFLDGSLSYDCIDCGFQCCRGHGYALSNDDIETHRSLSDRSLLFVEKQSAGRPHLMHNCAPGCFFLTDEGRCRIHAERGFDHKPETCRLFPFNEIVTVGDFLVVAPHASLCPLRFVEGASTAPESSHAILRAELGRGISVPIPKSTPILQDVNALVDLERAISSTLKAQRFDAPYEQSIYQQIAATACYFSEEKNDESPKEAVDAFLTSFRKLLGVWPSKESESNRQLAQAMRSMTPILRSALVFTRESDAGRFEKPRLKDVPLILLAVQKIAALAIDAGMASVSYQTVMKLFRTYQHLLRLAPQARHSWQWREDLQISLPPSGSTDQRIRIIRTAKNLLRSNQADATLSLGEIVDQSIEPSDIGRLEALNTIAGQLVGKIIRTQTPNTSRASVRTKLQHWALRTFDETVLLNVTELIGEKRS